MNEVNRIICGDSAVVLAQLPAGSVDLTVTSPPYDDLRTYRTGALFPFDEIATQLYRVTKQGGVVVWMVSDQTKNGSETGTSFRQALFFMGLGFNLHDTMIYEVAGTGAKGSHSCYWQAWEYMFVFSKGKPKTLNLLCDRVNAYHGAKTTGARRGVDGVRVIDPYRTPKMSKRTNVWRYQPGRNHSTQDSYAFTHPAVMHEQLAHDHIVSWSNPGDLILDPFVGSGTVPKMALLSGRDYIGIDIAGDYCELARRRVAEAEARTPAGLLSGDGLPGDGEDVDFGLFAGVGR